MNSSAFLIEARRMADRGTSVAVRIVQVTDELKAIKAFRGSTQETISSIREALNQQKPISIGQIFANDHDEVEQRILTLHRQLDALKAKYEIFVDGELESRDYLDNILKRWREIGRSTQMMTNLEFGEPDIETLEWLQREAPRDVFLQTLKQLLDSNSDALDSDMRVWIEQRLYED